MHGILMKGIFFRYFLKLAQAVRHIPVWLLLCRKWLKACNYSRPKKYLKKHLTGFCTRKIQFCTSQPNLCDKQLRPISQADDSTILPFCPGEFILSSPAGLSIAKKSR